MSRHVRRNADVAVVTGGQQQSGGSQSHDPASGPGGGCHKPCSHHRSNRWKGKEGKMIKVTASYVNVEKHSSEQKYM